MTDIKWNSMCSFHCLYWRKTRCRDRSLSLFGVTMLQYLHSSDRECTSVANLITLIYHAWVSFPEALRAHKEEYFQTKVSNTQRVGVQSMGAEQRLHEVKPEERTGLACAGTLTGALRRGSAPLHTCYFASEGSCWCWQWWEVALQPSTPCTA